MSCSDASSDTSKFPEVFSGSGHIQRKQQFLWGNQSRVTFSSRAAFLGLHKNNEHKHGEFPNKQIVKKSSELFVDRLYAIM